MRQKDRGFILVTVLLSSTLLVSLVIAYVQFARADFYTSRALLFRSQARSACLLAARMVAKGLLLDDNDHDSLDEMWAKPMALPLPEFGAATIEIEDLDRYIPLNNILLPDKVTVNEKMASALKRALDMVKLPESLPLILDFEDKDTRPRLGGEEDSYGGESSWKRPMNRAFISIEELLFLPTFEQKHLDGWQEPFEEKPVPGLKKLVSVWPDGKININTASKDVLLCIDQAIDETVADNIIAQRDESPFTSISDLEKITNFPIESIPRISAIIAFQSSWFNVKMTIVGDYGLYSAEVLIRRKKGAVDALSWREY